jgi:hypothetical protein
MTLFDNYIICESNSIESKNLLLTCLLNTNILCTKYKPLDLMLFKIMLDNKINITIDNVNFIIKNIIPFYILSVLHIFILARLCV